MEACGPAPSGSPDGNFMEKSNTDGKQPIHLVIEKGSCLALNLTAFLHQKSGAVASGDGLLHLSLQEMAAGEFISKGAPCQLKVDGNRTIRGRVETIARTGNTVNLMIKPV
jgi:hypothetical protein